jgi:hypothetical protein
VPTFRVVSSPTVVSTWSSSKFIFHLSAIQLCPPKEGHIHQPVTLQHTLYRNPHTLGHNLRKSFNVAGSYSKWCLLPGLAFYRALSRMVRERSRLATPTGLAARIPELMLWGASRVCRGRRKILWTCYMYDVSLSRPGPAPNFSRHPTLNKSDSFSRLSSSICNVSGLVSDIPFLLSVGCQSWLLGLFEMCTTFQSLFHHQSDNRSHDYSLRLVFNSYLNTGVKYVPSIVNNYLYSMLH